MAKHSVPASEFTVAREKRSYHLQLENGDRYPTSWGHVPQFCKARHCDRAGMESWVPVAKSTPLQAKLLHSSTYGKVPVS